MKLRFLLSAASVFLIATWVLSSCKAEPCDDVVCANNGICQQGLCKCLDGWEGARCETESRVKFLGTYAVVEDGTTSLPSTYTVNIHRYSEEDEDLSKVRLKGFYNYFDDEVFGICKGDSLIIPNQTLTDNYQVVGYGVFEASDFYGNHGHMQIFYQMKSPDGTTNDFGYDIGEPSEYSK